MERFDIQADQRLIARLVRAGTQGNAIRALLELVSNSDDSYRRLETAGNCQDASIELLYEKQGTCGVFTVRDHAEGMSHDDMIAAFCKYGAATSGLKDGKSVAGFFGTGAKNSLAGMTDGRLYTFKDHQFCGLRIYLDGDSLKGELEGPMRATEALRNQHGIAANGTAAYFRADPEKGQKVPRFDTVHTDLANHWRLRKIMTNPSRTVFLTDLAEKNRKRRLRYSMPKGQEQISEQFGVCCENYGEFPIRVVVLRSESELQQQGDDRQGGILIADDEDVALDMSLFKFDREPLAAHLFGQATFGRFRELLAKEEPVLDEKREGLNRNHPVCAAVIAAIEERLERLVQEESRRQKEARSRIDEDERTRYRGAFKVLNEIAEAEAQEVHNLGQEPSPNVEPPPNGLCLYPDTVHVSVGKRYAIELRVDTNKFTAGTVVSVSSNTPRLSIVGSTEFKVPKAKSGQVVQRYVTIQGFEVGRAILKAAIGKNVAEATIYVEPEKEENEYLFKHGMVFRPETLTVRMNKTRRALLRVYTKIVDVGSTIKISSDHESVHVWPGEIVVNEADVRRHVAEYQVEVTGDEPEVDAMVTAECETTDALLEVRTRVAEEEERPKGQGMFSGEPFFDEDDPEPLQRASYSRESGRVTIYANFPAVRHYLGEGLRYKKTLAAQVLIADLIAERCFFEVARAKKRDVAISPEALPERIQRDAQELSRKYGARVHKALVDPVLVKKDQAELIGTR